MLVGRMSPVMPHSGSLHLSSAVTGREGEQDLLPVASSLALKQEEYEHFDLQQPDYCLDTEPAEFPNHVSFQGPDFMCSSSSQESARCAEKNAPKPKIYGNTSELLDSGKVKAEPSDENDLLSHHRTALSASNAELTERNGKVQDDDKLSDKLDHVPLIQRGKMLLASRQLLRMNDSYSCISQVYEKPSLIGHVKEEVHCDSLGTGEDLADRVARRDDEVIHPISAESRTGNKLHGFGESQCSDIYGSLRSGTFVGIPCKDNRCSTLPGYTDAKVAVSAELRLNVEAQASEGTSSWKRKPSKVKSCSGSDHVPVNDFSNSTMRTAFEVKTEPSDHSEVLGSRCDTVGNFTFNASLVKREEEHDRLFEDKLDHMFLRERMNLLTQHTNSGSDHLKKCDWLTRDLTSSEKIPAVMKFVDPISIKRLQTRRKTVTDSIETVLEEDAPGLLRVLLDNGVSMDELKLYGDVENDEPLDESSEKGGFTELEDVISKLFFQRQSFLKIGLPKSRKDTKTTYCLACLFSLVEQTRYLQFRKWPVEWGWSRELRSFIFVFERHKRIVLERPEYGYATYFFELVDSLSIAWQVGEDLTEGEARVLMQYGWKPNSGLGTMLNYCDRVVHDRQKEMEKDTSEWRAKIGKLLMDGYHGGAIVSSDIVKKVTEYGNAEGAQVKTEL
ncbi:hypothetical protein CDL15_Pgr017663 [Punica granatum]|uniref:Uncharacterized protein n=1 Tax=Punica granatum TaxID=22663 RepID=A0A218XQJ7_PUNGR|nr:hypothetical protein CDL15_Pgr017663 [Punica granatum]